MADLPSREELFQRFRDSALAVADTKLSAREFDRPGSDLNLIAAAAAIMGEEMTRRMAQAVANSFEDTAESNGLDRVVFDRKGLPRKPAAPAVGQIELTRPAATAGAGVIVGGLPGSGPPAPTRIRTNQGIVYFLTENAVFGAADLGPITATVQAELAGIEQEVDENQAWNFVDVPFDTTIVIANPAEMAGAADEENDVRYRARAKNFFPTVRRGTIGAVQFGLDSTPGVDSATVIETINPTNGLPACSAQGFILDVLEQANQTLAARAQLVQLEYRPIGIPVVLIPGVPQFVDIEFSGSSFDTSIVLDTSTAANDVKTAIIAALNNQRPNQQLLRSTILAAARSVPGFVIEDTDLVEPAGTLIPASADVVFRTKRELILVA